MTQLLGEFQLVLHPFEFFLSVEVQLVISMVAAAAAVAAALQFLRLQ
jgi:hypothetical protein